MIPYIESHTLDLGIITIQTWGIFVSAGILTGLVVSAKRAEKLGLKKNLIYDAGVWIIAGAMLVARIFHILFYDIQTYINNPLEILRIDHGGLSITGGFIGAIIAGVWYYKKQNKKITSKDTKIDILKYADATIFWLPIGLGIGRIGCALIHDHPGTETTFALATKYPDQIIRHDHGIYLSINGFILAIIFAILARKKQKTGVFIAVFSIWYATVRFILDFLRIIDKTYLGLTPAQYASIALLVFGILITIKINKSRA